MLAGYDKSLYNLTLGATLVGFLFLVFGEERLALGLGGVAIVTGSLMIWALRQHVGTIRGVVTNMDRLTRLAMVFVAFILAVSGIALVTQANQINPLARATLAFSTGYIVVASDYYRNQQTTPDSPLSSESLVLDREE